MTAHGEVDAVNAEERRVAVHLREVADDDLAVQLGATGLQLCRGGQADLPQVHRLEG